MQLNIGALREESLEIHPMLDAHQLTIKLSGACDGFAVAPLGGYLKEVFAEMERLDCERVVFDIQTLYLLNSSCLKQFISFLHRIRAAGTQRHVDFVVDPRLAWQGRGLAAFVRMCPGTVSIVQAPSAQSA